MNNKDICVRKKRNMCLVTYLKINCQKNTDVLVSFAILPCYFTHVAKNVWTPQESVYFSKHNMLIIKLFAMDICLRKPERQTEEQLKP